MTRTNWDLAGDPSTPPETLAKLARIPGVVRFLVARNPSTPMKALFKIARGANSAQLYVCYNPKTPSILLEWIMAHHHGEIVHGAALQHPNLCYGVWVWCNMPYECNLRIPP